MLAASRVPSPLSINNGVVGEDFLRERTPSFLIHTTADDWRRKNPRRIFTKSCAHALAHKVLALTVQC